MQSIYKTIDGKNILYAWFEAMHTRIDIVLCDGNETVLTEIAILIRNELNRIEKIGSRFDYDSELAVVNWLACLRPTSISKELFSIITVCLDYYNKTDGCFDITINSDNYEKSYVPSIEMDKIESLIYFKNKNIKLDLNGYLKGYSLDRIKNILSTNNITDAFINLGNSSIYTSGNQPYGEGWQIGINNNQSSTVTLYNECLTTSGNEIKDRKHIKSPVTGKYVEGINSISVVTQDGVTGEVLSTALFVSDKENREQILKMFPASYIIT